MEDQYGIPSDHHLSHRSFQAPPPNPGGGFPLVSGGGLVLDQHHHHYASLYRTVHDHHIPESTTTGHGGAWNSTDHQFIVNNSNSNSNGILLAGEGGNNSRWPRQETLTLLEIRSRLNSKFKDTNQKAPLWDEISRIMAEEHGYQRSGKKCKEKFENLYKYYKKTKEGKAGRQDGKHYRFFRQLEAIYGDQTTNQITSSLLDTRYLGRNNSSLLYDHLQSNTNAHHQAMTRPTTNTNHETLSFSINSTEFDTSSSENNNNNNEDDLSAIAFKINGKDDDRKMKGLISHNQLNYKGGSSNSSSWKAKVEGFVDTQMKKIIATQETWMEKMLKSVIGNEEERLAREDECRRHEAARFDQEVSEFWAKEKAWVEARDSALMGALKNLRSKDSSLELPSFPERSMIRDHSRNNSNNDARSYDATTSNYQRWSEDEISSLIELKTSLETTYLDQESVYNVNHNNDHNRDGTIWEEIASKMGCLGYGRSANECREKWGSVSLYVTMTSECKKKRREDYYKTSDYYFNNNGNGQPLMELKQESNQVKSTNNVMGFQLMDSEGLNSPTCSNVGTSQMNNPNNFFHLLFGEGQNLWEKYETLKLGKDKTNQH